MLYFIPLAQNSKLMGAWYSKDQEVIVIEDTSGRLENLMQKSENFQKIDITRKVISFHKQYYSSATNYNILYTDKYDFKILQLDDSVLVLQPLSSFSKSFFVNRGKIKFIKKEYWKSQNLRFDKIIFHSSECFGSCPLIDFEINSTGAVKYKFGGWAADSASRGHFIGQMPDSVYSLFLNKLQNCQLETLRWNSVKCCDGVVVTLIIYFNNERKYIKSMLPSIVTYDLLSFFYTLKSKIKFTRTDQKFYMEE
jgi:Domain of unknown function (DUF6438)